MLHCCKCNKSKSPQRTLQNPTKLSNHQLEQKTQHKPNHQPFINKIKQNEQKILELYQQLQQDTNNLKVQNENLVKENQELKEKLQFLQQAQQSIQFIPQSHSRSALEETNYQLSSQQPYSSFYFHDPNGVKYQSLKKLYDELIREKDFEFSKRGTPTSQTFLKDILQQKAEDLELAQEQICKQNDIISQYEQQYHQLLQDYQSLEKQLFHKDRSNSDSKITRHSEYLNQSNATYYAQAMQDRLSGMIQEALKLSPKKIVIKTVN